MWARAPPAATSYPPVLDAPGYKFYVVGNVLDPRKQVARIVAAFVGLALDDCLLIVKATCREPVRIDAPGVHVINGLVARDVVSAIHEKCDCYVNFSFSEGVGMGAVEAALHGKPVICTAYGGVTEYVDTPYMIECGRRRVAVDDFLYTADLAWGDPSYDQLRRFMRHAHRHAVTEMAHAHTQEAVAGAYEKMLAHVK